MRNLINWLSKKSEELLFQGLVPHNFWSQNFSFRFVIIPCDTMHVSLTSVHLFDSYHFLFTPIYAVLVSSIPQTVIQTKWVILSLSFQFLFFFPFPFLWPACGSSSSTLWPVIVVLSPLLGNIFNEQHWNLVNIVFMVAKLGNICFDCKICVREAIMFSTWGKNMFCFQAAKFVSATYVLRVPLN